MSAGHAQQIVNALNAAQLGDGFAHAALVGEAQPERVEQRDADHALCADRDVHELHVQRARQQHARWEHGEHRHGPCAECFELSLRKPSTVNNSGKTKRVRLALMRNASAGCLFSCHAAAQHATTPLVAGTYSTQNRLPRCRPSNDELLS